AKRAEQERAAADAAARAAQAPAPAAGSSFGLGGKADQEAFDPVSLDLPQGFEKFLGR
ncbi:MAG: hypothetical protein JJE50_12835, partial [Actinomycetales bacterium]|nr:hypothetical protein [Actinomycetales bacterium]